MLGNVHEYFNETKPKKKGSKKWARTKSSQQ
jgi:hypothetical protein